MSNNVCSICYDDLVDNIYELDCKHRYHNYCIAEWLDSCKKQSHGQSCPECRADLSKGKDGHDGGDEEEGIIIIGNRQEQLSSHCYHDNDEHSDSDSDDDLFNDDSNSDDESDDKNDFKLSVSNNGGYVSIQNSNSWVHSVGNRLIDNVAIEIGGNAIDKQYDNWLNVWNELTAPT